MDRFLGGTSSSQGPTSSGLFDWCFALTSLAGITCLLRGILWISYPTYVKAYMYLWAFLVIRLHLYIYLLKSMPAFMYLSTRFPATWINTMVYFPIFFCFKVDFLCTLGDILIWQCWWNVQNGRRQRWQWSQRQQNDFWEVHGHVEWFGQACAFSDISILVAVHILPVCALFHASSMQYL